MVEEEIDDQVGSFNERSMFSILQLNARSLLKNIDQLNFCLLYTSPSPRDLSTSRMPSSA